MRLHAHVMDDNGQLFMVRGGRSASIGNVRCTSSAPGQGFISPSCPDSIFEQARNYIVGGRMAMAGLSMNIFLSGSEVCGRSSTGVISP